MLLTTGRELQFQPHKFVTLIANVRLNYGFRNTELLNYAGNDGTCDHSWLMTLLGNAPQIINLHQEVVQYHVPQDTY